MICAHDVAVNVAIALLFISMKKCVFERGLMFFKYGLYMFSVACMTFAHDVAVTFAIALLFMSRIKKMQNMDCVCL